VNKNVLKVPRIEQKVKDLKHVHGQIQLVALTFPCQLLEKKNDVLVIICAQILDATSNEPWGPHGSLLADIAQATHN
jgi:hypothetical protein